MAMGAPKLSRSAVEAGIDVVKDQLYPAGEDVEDVDSHRFMGKRLS